MTFEIALVLLVLGLTVVLFVSEWLRVDIIAIIVMLILAWLKLVTPAQVFSGFAGNTFLMSVNFRALLLDLSEFKTQEKPLGNVKALKKFNLLGISYRWYLAKGKMIFGKGEGGTYNLQYLEKEEYEE